MDRYEKDHWPEFYIAIPDTVMLACPRCKAEVRCDVRVNILPPAGLTVAARAVIDTDFCEGCGQLFCPQCPRIKHDGLDWCDSCAADEGIEAKK